MKHVASVHKYFRNHHRPGAWLKEYLKAVKPSIIHGIHGIILVIHDGLVRWIA